MHVKETAICFFVFVVVLHCTVFSGFYHVGGLSNSVINIVEKCVNCCVVFHFMWLLFVCSFSPRSFYNTRKSTICIAFLKAKIGVSCKLLKEVKGSVVGSANKEVWGFAILSPSENRLRCLRID